MPDLSHFDDKYFIDGHVYNCPFCRRRHVAYHVAGHQVFDWTDAKPAHVFICRCESCGKRSMHLTYRDIGLYAASIEGYRFKILDGEELDDAFFYSVPTSLFAIDQRVPREIRELLTEAEGCLKSNFLTGASACVRKIIYELAAREKADGNDYEERIKSLKKKRPDVDGTYFDTLLTIQQVTSEKVHENSHDGWSSRHLRLNLEHDA